MAFRTVISNFLTFLRKLLFHGDSSLHICDKYTNVIYLNRKSTNKTVVQYDKSKKEQISIQGGRKVLLYWRSPFTATTKLYFGIGTLKAQCAVLLLNT